MDNIPLRTGEGPQETREVRKDSAGIIVRPQRTLGGQLHNERLVALRPKLSGGRIFRVAATSKNWQPRILRKLRVGEGNLALYENRTARGLDLSCVYAIAAETRISAILSLRRWHSPVVLRSHKITSGPITFIADHSH
jgi:hypothetical protein